MVNTLFLSLFEWVCPTPQQPQIFQRSDYSSGGSIPPTPSIFCLSCLFLFLHSASHPLPTVSMDLYHPCCIFCSDSHTLCEDQAIATGSRTYWILGTVILKQECRILEIEVDQKPPDEGVWFPLSPVAPLPSSEGYTLKAKDTAGGFS